MFFWRVLKHIGAAGPGSGMNTFNIKKLRSEGRATQTAANLMLNKAKGGKKVCRSLPKPVFGCGGGVRFGGTPATFCRSCFKDL